MARQNDNYFKRRAADEERTGQKKFNLQQATGERYGIKQTWEVMNPVEDEDIKRKTEPAFQNITAPTINPSRPRAKKLAYSRETETLVIRFRDDSWIGYDGVPIEMWNDLKASNSTGRYLKYSGLDDYPWYNFDPSNMEAETRVIFNS
jgi:hypothetical protein